jgi:hypothetical protein
MHEAVLLLDAFPVRSVNLGATILDARQRRPNQAHGVLSLEAGGDGLGKVRICDPHHEASGSESGILQAPRTVALRAVFGQLGLHCPRTG